MKHSAIRKRGRFRPLAGMVLRKVGTYDGDVGFRPLTGISCNSGNSVAHGSLYRVSVPLRGWYAIEKVQNDGKSCFRPLTGMVLNPAS